MQKKTSRSNRSPWLSIWTEPRLTIHTVIERRSNYEVLWVGAMLGFFYTAIMQSGFIYRSEVDLSTDFWMLTFSPLIGVFVLHLWALILRIIGVILGGQASYIQVRAALTWSLLPLLLLFTIWGGVLPLLGRLTEGQPVPIDLGRNVRFIPMFVFLVIHILLPFWSLLIFIVTFSEVQGFSEDRAFWSFVLSFITVPIIIFLALLVIYASMVVR